MCLLQVCLCCLVRHEPGIAPSVVASAPSLLAPPRHRPITALRHRLLADTVTLTAALPDLCSPAGGTLQLLKGRTLFFNAQNTSNLLIYIYFENNIIAHLRNLVNSTFIFYSSY